MNINRVTIAGFTGKEAKSSSTQNGRNMTKLSVATTTGIARASGRRGRSGISVSRTELRPSTPRTSKPASLCSSKAN